MENQLANDPYLQHVLTLGPRHREHELVRARDLMLFWISQRREWRRIKARYGDQANLADEGIARATERAAKQAYRVIELRAPRLPA